MEGKLSTVDREIRSKMMASIPSKNTRPELAVRRYLHSQGFRFRIHNPRLPGSPDIVLAKHKLCIFVNGCFWHRHASCPFAYTPKTRQEFWSAKFQSNIDRDCAAIENLHKIGWRIIVIWECGIRKADCCSKLSWLPEKIRGSDQFFEWPHIAK